VMVLPIDVGSSTNIAHETFQCINDLKDSVSITKHDGDISMRFLADSHAFLQLLAIQWKHSLKVANFIPVHYFSLPHRV
jgi:hypothetical protein